MNTDIFIDGIWYSVEFDVDDMGKLFFNEVSIGDVSMLGRLSDFEEARIAEECHRVFDELNRFGRDEG